MKPFTAQIPISAGWSADQKFQVTDESGARYLLRISPPETYEKKAGAYARMETAAALGIPMCRPVALERQADGVYFLQTWIDGEDAEPVIPTLSGEQQYRYGMDAGHILRQIHSVPAPASQEEWEIRFNRKLDRKIAGYENCPLKYENGEAFLSCIAENRRLLRSRPQSYHHGDYHIGNMMLDRADTLTIIDFDRDDYGDPWEEFNRIVWCAQVSALFASGMVDGYFGGPPPMEFWRLLALYISSNSLSSLYWAIPFGEKEVDVMRRQAKEVLAWYDNMRNPVPTWYQGRQYKL